jgi:nitrilase
MTKENGAFRVAAVQLSPVLFDRDGTTEKVIKALERCQQEEVKLVVFPETFIPNYPYFSWVEPPAVIA